MKIATWNINGVRARVDTLLTWLAETKPDVVCLQEIKSVDEGFPRDAIEAAGYDVAVHGQKGFNGVALLSRTRLEDVERGLPGDQSDEQSRHIEGSVTAGVRSIRIGGLYLPNGNPLGTDKFQYKLRWMGRLELHARDLVKSEQLLVLAGDFNVIPEAVDAKSPGNWTGDALFQPESRASFRRLQSLGLTDAIRSCHPNPGVFTFWDYQAGAWQKDEGIRIDHLMLSPQATDRLIGAGIDKFTRSWEKPSDHVPVWVELDV